MKVFEPVISPNFAKDNTIRHLNHLHKCYPQDLRGLPHLVPTALHLDPTRVLKQAPDKSIIYSCCTVGSVRFVLHLKVLSSPLWSGPSESSKFGGKGLILR